MCCTVIVNAVVSLGVVANVQSNILLSWSAIRASVQQTIAYMNLCTARQDTIFSDCGYRNGSVWLTTHSLSHLCWCVAVSYKLNESAGSSLCAQEASQPKLWVIQAVIWSGLVVVSLAQVAKTFLGCTLPHSPQYCLPKLPQHWPRDLTSRYMHAPQSFRMEVWLWCLPCQASTRPEYRNEVHSRLTGWKVPGDQFIYLLFKKVFL